MRSTILPTHPRTGHRAVGWRKPRHGEVGQQPIWPIAGGAPDDPPADPPADPADPPADPDSRPKDPDPAATPWGDPEAAKAEIEKLRRENASWRTKYREAEPLVQKAKELEDASKSETEKLNERLTSSESRATTAEAASLRLEVALDKAPEGMPLAQLRKLAKRLSGSTREELEADAEELFADFVPADPGNGGRPPSQKPTARLRGGGDPTEGPDETDPHKLAALIPRR